MRMLKCVVVGMIAWIGIISVLYARAPYAPDFSLSIHTQEPPPLSRDYNMKLPNAWEYYALQRPEQDIIVPTEPIVMEVCAIVDKTTYSYPTKEDLLQGCYRNDNGLMHLILQPYQYLPYLDTLQALRLMPSTRQVIANPQIVIYYKITDQAQNFITSLEFGNLFDMNGIFMINGKAYQYNQDVITAFYNLIVEAWNTTYLPDQKTYTATANCNYCY